MRENAVILPQNVAKYATFNRFYLAVRHYFSIFVAKYAAFSVVHCRT